mmetsp:Transcript_41095/g.50027  ORF Transcript_41095/g.50027 Transcript_41095/m.50027 type:complete len:243 (-) Transcript_41095:729-1457(-)
MFHTLPHLHTIHIIFITINSIIKWSMTLHDNPWCQITIYSLHVTFKPIILRRVWPKIMLTRNHDCVHSAAIIRVPKWSVPITTARESLGIGDSTFAVGCVVPIQACCCCYAAWIMLRSSFGVVIFVITKPHHQRTSCNQRFHHIQPLIPNVSSTISITQITYVMHARRICFSPRHFLKNTATDIPPPFRKNPLIGVQNKRMRSRGSRSGNEGVRGAPNNTVTCRLLSHNTHTVVVAGIWCQI